MAYDLNALKAPRAAGTLLRILARVVEFPTMGKPLANKFLSDAGVNGMRAVETEEHYPLQPPHMGETAEVKGTNQRIRDLLQGLDQPPAGAARGFAFETAAHFTEAYRQGKLNPVDIAQRVLEAVRSGDRMTPPMRTFIAQDEGDLLEQARAASRRYEEGHPLGPLDGVPVAVKDELDQAPYPTTVGTSFLGTEPAAADAEVVARLRRAGALLIGKTNMHEIGLGVTGVNPHHGAARNPYDPARATGGSSSGPAAAVAAGLCPLAVGADGGGSIRIPSSLCGVVGLKATFGRVSEHGAAPLCWSLAHVGPIGATARDVALGYAVMAGPDMKDVNSLGQPLPNLEIFGDRDLSGLTIGIYPEWFDDGDEEIVPACRKIVDGLVEAGARVKEIEIPELGLLRTVHLVTIISEMAAAHIDYYARHRKDYGLDTRLNLALARRLTSYDYIHAQRHRVRLSGHFARALKEVDVIATPATGCTAPVISEKSLKTGESNLTVTDRIMRFCPPANLTGLPAISFPAGYDSANLPIGFQVIGRHWSEALLLRIADTAEAFVGRQPPKVHTRLLEGK